MKKQVNPIKLSLKVSSAVIKVLKKELLKDKKKKSLLKEQEKKDE